MSSLVKHKPGPAALVADLFSSYEHWWALCGGWAVDAWLGGVERRHHGDVDVCVFGADQRALHDLTREWHLVVHGPNLVGNPTDQWDGSHIDTPAHIHARPPGPRNRELLIKWITPPHRNELDGQDVELVINERSGAEWLLSTSPRVGLPLERCARESSWGIPTVVPEVLMFFKATAYWGTEGYPRPRDLADFEALLPLLDGGERAWLRDAIATVVPEQPWLGQLA